MNSMEFPFAITVLAYAVASEIPDDTELSLLALAATQLGDTLASIAAARTAAQRKSGTSS